MFRVFVEACRKYLAQVPEAVTVRVAGSCDASLLDLLIVPRTTSDRNREQKHSESTGTQV